jgi:predicted ATP-dependent endonuclease of OLD family
MTENFDHKIQRLELENFTCFSKASLTFSSGINVFIGENGTGKTHVLKALYALVNDVKSNPLDREKEFYEYFKTIREKHNLDRLGLYPFFIKFWLNNHSFSLSSSHHIKSEHSKAAHNFQIIDKIEQQKTWAKLDALFIPPQEILSINKGLFAAIDNQELAFDKTIYDLSKKLGANVRKNEALKNALGLLNGFEKEIGLKDIEERGTEFFLTLENTNQTLEARLVAEGLRRLAQIVHLIKNGSLKRETILFWDEPETNLNPKYIKIVAHFLQVLAQNGMQIFIATHDYLLTYLLSLSAEYPKNDTPPMRFFGFYKSENGTEVEFANTMNGIKNNAILEEFGAYHDLMMSKALESIETISQ